jgi:16S rRNA (cytosine1402-N4)-methyltransferase
MASDDAEKLRAHEPVLLEEVTGWLRPEAGGTFVDCTLGLGGHSEAILRASTKTSVIGIDRDTQALELARERLAGFGGRFHAVHANFQDLAEVLHGLAETSVRGVLADLGVSSLQLDEAERGFSFSSDAPLDMRMDQTSGLTAADLVGELSERELADLIFDYGEERGARKVARAIVREREREPITSTARLRDITVRALNIQGRWRIHPATRTFQALRIRVNDELRAVEALVPAAVSALQSGGRLAVISFHSLEDRLVKQAFRRESGRCTCERPTRETTVQGVAGGPDKVVCGNCNARERVRVLTRKPVTPGDEEVRRNPRSRSARLRVCERL